MEYKNDYKKTILWALITIVPFLLQTAGIIDTGKNAISKDNGLISIVTGVVLHGGWRHMIGNLLGMLMGVSLLVIFYKKAYFKVMAFGYFAPAIVMYMLGHASIGISGLVYTVIWFVILSGIISNVKEKFYVGMLVLVVYGSTLNGAVPPRGFSNIAWQAHLVGLLVAIYLVLSHKLKRKYKISKRD